MSNDNISVSTRRRKQQDPAQAIRQDLAGTVTNLINNDILINQLKTRKLDTIEDHSSKYFDVRARYDVESKKIIVSIAMKKELLGAERSAAKMLLKKLKGSENPGQQFGLAKEYGQQFEFKINLPEDSGEGLEETSESPTEVREASRGANKPLTIRDLLPNTTGPVGAEPPKVLRPPQPEVNLGNIDLPSRYLGAAKGATVIPGVSSLSVDGESAEELLREAANAGAQSAVLGDTPAVRSSIRSIFEKTKVEVQLADGSTENLSLAELTRKVASGNATDREVATWYLIITDTYHSEDPNQIKKMASAYATLLDENASEEDVSAALETLKRNPSSAGLHSFLRNYMLDTNSEVLRPYMEMYERQLRDFITKLRTGAYLVELPVAYVRGNLVAFNVGPFLVEIDLGDQIWRAEARRAHPKGESKELEERLEEVSPGATGQLPSELEQEQGEAIPGISGLLHELGPGIRLRHVGGEEGRIQTYVLIEGRVFAQFFTGIKGMAGVRYGKGFAGRMGGEFSVTLGAEAEVSERVSVFANVTILDKRYRRFPIREILLNTDGSTATIDYKVQTIAANRVRVEAQIGGKVNLNSSLDFLARVTGAHVSEWQLGEDGILYREVTFRTDAGVTGPMGKHLRYLLLAFAAFRFDPSMRNLRDRRVGLVFGLYGNDSTTTRIMVDVSAELSPSRMTGGLRNPSVGVAVEFDLGPVLKKIKKFFNWLFG